MFSIWFLIPLVLLIAVNIPLGFLRKSAYGAALLFSISQILLAFSPWTDRWESFFQFQLASDGLTSILLFTIGLVAWTSLMAGLVHFKDETKRFHFANLLLVSMAGMNAVSMVTDLFSLYVFLEIAAVSSFILIAIEKGKDAFEGAFKYLILSALASVLILSSIGCFLFAGQGLAFTQIRDAVLSPADPFMLRLAAGLLFIGLFIKAGLVPFHWWLPDTYSAAPAPVSILLAGIVTKATGVYALIRLSIVLGPIPGLREAMLAIGLLTILFGAFAAIGQKEFKRMLAYSSASQVGYIVLALGCGTPLALVGAVFHFLNHSVFKTLLFVDSAAMESTVGNTDLNGVTGLTSKMPVTGTTSVLALLATAGIPPLSGFWSKLVIFLALWQAGYKIWAAVAVVASIVTLAYFLSMQRRVFFGKPSEGLNVREADWKLVLPEIVLAALVVGIGVGFPFVLAKILPIQNLLK